MRQTTVVRSTAMAAGLALTLAACGSTPEERGVSGGGIGAAAGAVVGAVSGGLSVLTGAVIGAGTGAAAGALTSAQDINLGEPIWKSSSGTGSTTSAIPHGTVSDIQAELMMRGYDPGPLDGRYGQRTADAIRQYQSEHGLEADGQATPDLLEHMQRS